MRDLLSELARLRSGGKSVGRAVVVSTWGSAPRAEGACLLVTPEGDIAGSISGGCVESTAAEEVIASLEGAGTKLVTYGVSDEKAWEVGLSCGGTIEVLIEPGVRSEVVQLLEEDRPFVLATAIGGPDPIGTAGMVFEDGTVQGPLPALAAAETPSREESPEWSAVTDALVRESLDALSRERSGRVELEGEDGQTRALFLEVMPASPKLVVFGAVHVAQVLAPLAKKLGYHVTVADGRSAFANRERFPDADRVIHAWPQEAFADVVLDSNSYVCVLSHDPKFDEPALEIALRSPAKYVGAIGSRRTQAARRERLIEAGLSPEDVDRLRGPIGLDLGGRDPGEIALAVLAEITAVRYGGAVMRS